MDIHSFTVFASTTTVPTVQVCSANSLTPVVISHIKIYAQCSQVLSTVDGQVGLNGQAVLLSHVVSLALFVDGPAPTQGQPTTDWRALEVITIRDFVVSTSKAVRALTKRLKLD